MMPIDVGLSLSNSNAVQFGDFQSGQTVSGGSESWVKWAVIGGVALLAFFGWMLTRK